jgi:hypothetical protein
VAQAQEVVATAKAAAEVATSEAEAEAAAARAQLKDRVEVQPFLIARERVRCIQFLAGASHTVLYMPVHRVAVVAVDPPRLSHCGRVGTQTTPSPTAMHHRARAA